MTRATAVAIALALAGCVAQPRPDVPPDLVARQAALELLQEWQLEGRMAVRHDQRGFSGSVHWHQQVDWVDAFFHGPLGAGAFNLRGTADNLIVETADGGVFQYSDPELMLGEQFGWTIPIGAMRYWLLGLAEPGSAAEQQLDENGYLAALRQRDWTISYSRYSAFEDYVMPGKITMSNDEVTVRLAIHSWNLQPN